MIGFMSAESIAISSDRVVRFTSRAALLAALAAVLLGLTHAASAADEKPVASTASGNGKLRVEILSLKRIEADLVTLRWQIVNDDDKDFSMTPGNARLVDLAGRREYSPGLTSNGCRADAGKRTMCWATFAAPPQATKTMAVKFYENLEMVMGVPVTN